MSIKRFVKALALAALLLLPATAWCGDKTLTVYPATDTTATGTGTGVFDTGGYAFMNCAVNISAGSGTLTGLNIYLQGSYDGGTTWVDLYPDLSSITTATNTPAGSAPTLIQKREIATAAAQVSFPSVYWARYANSIAPLIRGAWSVAGGAANHDTFSIICTLKD